MKLTLRAGSRRIPHLTSAMFLALAASACEKKPEPAPTPAPATSASITGGALVDAAPAKPAGVKLEKVTRADFNRLAAELALPIFWIADKNKDGAIDPDELAVYWGLVPGAKLAEYVDKDGFTTKAEDAIESIVKRSKETAPPAGLDPKEIARREAVKKELAQGRVTLVATDLSKARRPRRSASSASSRRPPSSSRSSTRSSKARLDLRAKIAAGDPASTSLFFRNQSPKCEAPADAERSARAARSPTRRRASSPGSIRPRSLENPKFCDDLATKLEARKKDEGPDGSLHRRHATAKSTATRREGRLKAVPVPRGLQGRRRRRSADSSRPRPRRSATRSRR